MKLCVNSISFCKYLKQFLPELEILELNEGPNLVEVFDSNLLDHDPDTALDWNLRGHEACLHLKNLIPYEDVFASLKPLDFTARNFSGNEL